MRTFFLLFMIIILIGSTLIMAESVSGQSITKPTVPEFTLTVIDNSCDVPATNTTNHYTGEVTIVPGYRVEKKTIELSIKNQPINYSTNGTTYDIFLAVRRKPHFYEEWTERTYVATGHSSPGEYSQYISKYCPRQSNTEYTTFSFSEDYPPNAQMDFQVQALLGHDSEAWAGQFPWPGCETAYYYPAIAFDESSGWSDIQTIKINESPSTATPTSSVQPAEPQNTGLFGLDWEQTAIVVLAVLVAVSWVAIVVFWRKRSAR